MQQTFKNQGTLNDDNVEKVKSQKKMPTLERREQEAKDKDNAEKLAKQWKENAEQLMKKENSEFIQKMSYRDMRAIELHAYWGHNKQAFKDGDPNCKDFSDIVENSSLRIVSPSEM